MECLEIEVKFLLTDIDTLRNRLIKLGATSDGRSFESNLIFDDEANRLALARSLLRLRQARTATLTFKSPPDQANEAFKVLHEIEVGVDDFPAMKKILEALGYEQKFIYEKWRESFLLEDTHFCIDTLPFGHFLEIEGQMEKIQKFADQLELSWPRRIVQNYHQLFRIIRHRLELGFSDITFDNFAKAGIEPEHCTRILDESGQGTI